MICYCYHNFPIYIPVSVFVTAPKTCPAWLVQQSRTVQPTDAGKFSRLAKVSARQGEGSNQGEGKLVPKGWQASGVTFTSVRAI